MFDDLQNRNGVPETIAHLWNVTRNEHRKSVLSRIDKTQDLGIYSLLYIAQAIGKHDGSNAFQIEVVFSLEWYSIIGMGSIWF